MKPIPTIEQVLQSQTTSFWLVNALRASIQRDPLDAYYDAQLLADILKMRKDELLNQAPRSLRRAWIGGRSNL